MNVELLKATKESIAGDRYFNLADWPHCIGGHICRAAGLEVIEGSRNIGDTHIAQLANQLAGFANGSPNGLYYRGNHPEDRLNKQIAYDRIDKLIADAERDSIAEPEHELVGV